MTKKEIKKIIGKEEKIQRPFTRATYETMKYDEFFVAIREDLEFSQDEMALLFKVIFKDSFNKFSKSFISILEAGKLKKKGVFYQEKVLDYFFGR